MQGRRHKKRKNDTAKQQHPQTASPLLCLGTDVVNNVFIQLARTLEPGGVRGPSLVARDLAAAAQVCKEFRAAAQHGFEQLADLVYSQLQQQLGMPTGFNETQQALFMELHGNRLGPPFYMDFHSNQSRQPALYLLPPTSACGPVSIAALALAYIADRLSNDPNSSPSNSDRDTATEHTRERMLEDPSKLKQAWAFWDAIISCPASSSYEQLTEAALKLGLPLSHPFLHDPVTREPVPLTHAELLQSVLAVFGVTAATKVPAVVLAAMAREHMSNELVCDGPQACGSLHALLKSLAELARDAYIPLGLKAQGWGYGQRRPPGWPKRREVPAHQRGIPVHIKGGLAAVRAGLAAAGINTMRRLRALAAAERQRVEQLREKIAAQLGHTTAQGAAQLGHTTAQGEDAAVTDKQQGEVLQRQKLVSEVWKTDRKAAQQQKLAGQMGKFGQVLCGCGGVAAKHCARGSCAKCCIAAAVAETAAADGNPAPQQVTCLRHKVCLGCGFMEAAKHCVRSCCAHCCEQAAQAEGARGPCIKH